jgi:allophanate hydrolase subunit 2
VQVPANGLPIALMADHQTTGGYPKIAEIAAADVPRLAQLAPGGTVQFARCTLEQAGELRGALRLRLDAALRSLAWKHGQ